MPRRKTVQPHPLQLIDCDEFFIEVRDRSTSLIGRGLHTKQDFAETLEEIFDFVVPKVFVKKIDGNWRIKDPTFLKNPSKFARECELRGIDRESSSLRKRYFPAVKDWLKAISAAINQSQSPKLGILALPVQSRNQTGTA
jgi:hypothetical protein